MCIIRKYRVYKERQNFEATPKKRDSLILQNSLRNYREQKGHAELRTAIARKGKILRKNTSSGIEGV
jgi:hypothetical protein